jgi:uncharacterized protein
MPQLRIDIPPDHIASFCRANGIRRFSLYGSIMRDDFGPESDVDVLVEFEPDTHIGLRFFELEFELADLFGRNVVLTTPNALKPEFRRRILAQAEPVYERE